MRPDTVIAVYILANRRNGTTYTGVTSNLFQRIWQHRTGVTEGFAIEAIIREKAIKKWRRGWKLALIEKANPQWKDLAADWFGTGRS